VSLGVQSRTSSPSRFLAQQQELILHSCSFCIPYGIDTMIIYIEPGHVLPNVPVQLNNAIRPACNSNSLRKILVASCSVIPYPTPAVQNCLAPLKKRFPVQGVVVGDSESLLPEGYKMKRHDVVCEPQGVRDRCIYPGNERFRVLVDMCVERYAKAKGRLGKIEIIKEIVGAVYNAGGNFIRQAMEYKDLGDGVVVGPGEWTEIGECKAREKAGHALRNYLNKNKKKGTNVDRDDDSIGEGNGSNEAKAGESATEVPAKGPFTTISQPERASNSNELEIAAATKTKTIPVPCSDTGSKRKSSAKTASGRSSKKQKKAVSFKKSLPVSSNHASSGATSNEATAPIENPQPKKLASDSSRTNKGIPVPQTENAANSIATRPTLPTVSSNGNGVVNKERNLQRSELMGPPPIFTQTTNVPLVHNSTVRPQMPLPRASAPNMSMYTPYTMMHGIEGVNLQNWNRLDVQGVIRAQETWNRPAHGAILSQASSARLGLAPTAMDVRPARAGMGVPAVASNPQQYTMAMPPMSRNAVSTSPRRHYMPLPRAQPVRPAIVSNEVVHMGVYSKPHPPQNSAPLARSIDSTIEQRPSASLMSVLNLNEDEAMLGSVLLQLRDAR
jgi:hypothetical protein